MFDLFILNLECGEAGLQLLTPLEQLAFHGLLCTHHSHLHPHTHTQTQWKVRQLTSCDNRITKTTHLIIMTQALELYRVSHVGLEVKASWGAEDVVVGLHQFLFVSVGLQTFCSSLQCLQAGVFGRLYVLFCR